MSYPLQSIQVTDEHGTDYTDLFADVDLEAADLIGGTGISAVDVTIPNLPVSARSNLDGPLGALIDRWIRSRAEHDDSTYGWQYLDANDIHTIAWEEEGQVTFVNIFGYSADGQRAYRLRSIAAALQLHIQINLA
ncbi:MAG: hypothetical protein ABJA94_11105 [Rhodoglobus sp.]